MNKAYILQNNEKLLAIRLLSMLQKKLLWNQIWLKEYNALCIFPNKFAKPEKEENNVLRFSVWVPLAATVVE